ncbi:hypothetical protein MCOR25_010070 [Pyricularia grisea]|uniref:Protein-lysine N-methyltransferase EFM4 n=1 Tax=Pyricularia grisea TaxID=148305 RepID=A0A6P8B8A1_PYRGI|nr:uncharacterized protein PgNI_03217 [Pyricularia grisea]KAI6351228.1 hypothetical protein MCOR25_010070 [Pyricularia grisea]TLD12043.1 hypothetical protein PgNI_03217 [Pyricularia grisea]
MAETGQTTSKPEHLEPSKLGTKEYWDALYDTEITNHETNPSDIGTVWFDDSDAEAKMVSFLNTKCADLGLDRDSTSFVDLGTGNGSMLHALRRAGWAGPCLGVDYSPAAVALAQKVAASTTYSEASDDDDEDDEEVQKESNKREPSNNPISFAQWDVLDGPLDPDVAATPRRGSWDVVLDKGTFDAVCLSADVDAATGRRRSEDYRARVLELLRPGDGGVFLVTSCNWTEEELRAWFEGEAGEGAARLVYAGQVHYRSFSFGGVKGQTISTVCFVKKDSTS